MASSPAGYSSPALEDFSRPPLYREMLSPSARSPRESGDLGHSGVPEGALMEADAPFSGMSRHNSLYTLPTTPIRAVKNRPLHLPLSESPEAGSPPAPTGAGGESGRRRSTHVVLPLFSTECVASESVPHSRAHRHPSLSCVSLSDAELASIVQSPLRISALQARRYAQSSTTSAPDVRLVPSHPGSVASTAVFERTNFITKAAPLVSRPSRGRGYPVSLHVYDLSMGLLDKYSEKFVGVYVPGMYHSAVVCYGMEFYFEGGIGIAGPGRTRFGERFKSVPLGYTRRPLSAFLEWIDNKEVTTHQVQDYHLTRHNCHNFCDEAATFLLGRSEPIPRYLFTTVETLLSSELGAAVHEMLDVTTRGTQQAVSRLMKLRVLERQASMDMILHGVAACGVLVMPPIATVLFRVDDPKLRARSFSDVEPYIDELIRKEAVRPSAMSAYRALAQQLCAGADTLAGEGGAAFADLLAAILLHSPLALWGPPLNALRLAVLHRSVAVAVVFHTRLLQLLLLGSRDLPRLLPDGRLALLRVFCNFGATPHGAAALQDNRFCPFFSAVVGQGLLDDNGAICFAAACLANNVALSAAILSMPSLKRNLAFMRERHPLMALLTIALYNVNHRSAEELPEPTFNMLLLAILRIVATCSVAVESAVEHPFRLRYTDFLRRAETNESRALLCILKTIEDLYRP